MFSFRRQSPVPAPGQVTVPPVGGRKHSAHDFLPEFEPDGGKHLSVSDPCAACRFRLFETAHQIRQSIDITGISRGIIHMFQGFLPVECTVNIGDQLSGKTQLRAGRRLHQFLLDVSKRTGNIAHHEKTVFIPRDIISGIFALLQSERFHFLPVPESGFPYCIQFLQRTVFLPHRAAERRKTPAGLAEIMETAVISQGIFIARIIAGRIIRFRTFHCPCNIFADGFKICRIPQTWIALKRLQTAMTANPVHGHRGDTHTRTHHALRTAFPFQISCDRHVAAGPDGKTEFRQNGIYLPADPVVFAVIPKHELQGRRRQRFQRQCRSFPADGFSVLSEFRRQIRKRYGRTETALQGKTQISGNFVPVLFRHDSSLKIAQPQPDVAPSGKPDSAPDRFIRGMSVLIRDNCRNAVRVHRFANNAAPVRRFRGIIQQNIEHARFIRQDPLRQFYPNGISAFL